MKTKHTPGPLSFDGCGINGGDEYRSRIATFQRTEWDGNAKHYGPLFAAAPDLLATLKDMLRYINSGEIATVEDMEFCKGKLEAAIRKAELGTKAKS